MEITYLLGYFPKTESETFVLNEMLQLELLGNSVSVIASDGESVNNEDYLSSKLSKRVSYTYGTQSPHAKVLVSIKKILLFSLCHPFLSLSLFLKCIKYTSSINNFIFSFLNAISFNNFKSDVVHLSFPRINFLEAAIIIKKQWGTQFTCTFRALDIYETNNKQDYYWELTNEASSLVTISQQNQKFIRDLTGKSPVVIHSAVNLALFTPKNSLQATHLKFITVGRFIEKKGLEYLLKAYGAIYASGVSFSAEIIGSGSLRNRLISLIDELNLQNIVKLIDPLPHSVIMEKISTSSLFILPCVIAQNGDRDILPNVVKEAMAMELPVITTDISGISELVDDNESGFLIPERDVEALTLKILDVINLEKEELVRIGKNGRKKILKDFDITSEAEKLNDLLKGVVYD